MNVQHARNLAVIDHEQTGDLHFVHHLHGLAGERVGADGFGARRHHVGGAEAQ